jgi:predicted DNA binding CopG/RHH family protein
MERAMKTSKLPQTDSIQELARFWQAHDLTEFEAELEEVTKPVFASGDSIRLCLASRDAKAVRRLAESKGVSQAELVRQWVLQKLAHRKRGGQAKG